MKYAITFLIVLAVGYYAYQSDLFKSNNTSVNTNPTVILMTNKGDIEIELFADKAPKTVKNFLTLAESNFYDDTLFHRVIKGFMIQAGDPNTRAGSPNTFGMGGPGYSIPDEFGPGLSNVKGTISMANSGPNSGGSQFFVNVNDNTFLDGKHAVFGTVTKGYDIAVGISQVETVDPKNHNDLPVDPVRIDRVVIKSAQ
jgi:cyclophilin family peptidyl-prolyl cis-trans isomerase